VTRVLVAYASIDGQAAGIAERIGRILAENGHAVTTRAASDPELAAGIGAHDAVLVGASVRYGHHARAVEKWVRANLAPIAARRNAFFSVSLSAGGPGADLGRAEGYVSELIRHTGWHPAHWTMFAGALRYTTYRPWIRWLMRMIVGQAGGHTDTSRDYEYTDWEAVDRFARDLAAHWAR
jgi:menaquinone-dependent protoporphyrinogen oxidase